MTDNSDEGADELLTRLGRVAAEQGERPLWPELERLTRGELDAEQIADLEQRSQSDLALRQAFDAHRPLLESDQERISQSILGALSRSPVREPVATGGLAPMLSASKPKVTRPGSRRYRRALWFATPMLAAAAAVALWLQAPSLEPLTPYRLEVQGAAAATRAPTAAGTPTQPIRVVPGQSLEILLRPAIPHTAEVEGRVFIEAMGQLSLLDSSVERSASGSLRIAFRIPEALTHGAIVVVVASSAKAAALAQSGQDSGSGWQRFRIEFESKPPL